MTMRERMGPGGLRGLQILRSGANHARGGFDSHAFPPGVRGPRVRELVGLLLLGALMTGEAGSGRAAEPRAVTDSVAAIRSRSRTAERLDATPRRFDAPRWVMLRSLAVPGWGQAHNRAWIKAAGIATAEVWLGARILEEGRSLDRLEAEVNRTPLEDPARNRMVDDYNARLDRLTSRQWLLAAVVTYSLLDAYVDAHFRDFGIALLGGSGAAGGSGMRAAVWRRF